MDLRDRLLPRLDRIRGIPGRIGLRKNIVAVRIRTWSGTIPGEGTKTDQTLILTTNLGLTNVKVRNVTQRDAIASGGIYTDQDLIVGPITPAYPGSDADNNAASILDPPQGSSPTEVFFRVQGGGYSDAGDWFIKIGQRSDEPFRITLWLRKTGQVFD